ncbi:hypothetical protein F4604DRAFT_1595367 [Suillus subluteus]|nr:hypothetical protein F4604DRAFT_1595367 [Suillus subluteus]
MVGLRSALQAFSSLNFIGAEGNDPKVCPTCEKIFKTPSGMSSHLSTAQSCRWYKKGKLKGLSIPGQFEEQMVSEEVDEPLPKDMLRGRRESEPASIMEDYQDLLYELLPLPETGDMENETQAQAGPSHGYWTTVEDAEEDDELRKEVDERVEEENKTAGASIRLVETLHERWRRNFGPEKDRNGDINMADISSELEVEDGKFALFNSELDWRIARWAIQDGIGHKSFDRLMAIPGVVDKLGLSFHNIRGLHQVVNGVPARAQWKTRQLWYKSDPEDKHTIYYRNPCDVMQSLLGNPAFTNDIVYRPKKIFTDSSKNTRIYNEMWTGDWWHSVQVRS